MKKKESSIRLLLEVLPIIFKIFIGAIACFLIFFGIHWVAILAGFGLGIVYYIIPQKQ